jgi:hypothetical protein
VWGCSLDRCEHGLVLRVCRISHEGLLSYQTCFVDLVSFKKNGREIAEGARILGIEVNGRPSRTFSFFKSAQGC